MVFKLPKSQTHFWPHKPQEKQGISKECSTPRRASMLCFQFHFSPMTQCVEQEDKLGSTVVFPGSHNSWSSFSSLFPWIQHIP